MKKDLSTFLPLVDGNHLSAPKSYCDRKTKSKRENKLRFKLPRKKQTKKKYRKKEQHFDTVMTTESGNANVVETMNGVQRKKNSKSDRTMEFVEVDVYDSIENIIESENNSISEDEINENQPKTEDVEENLDYLFVYEKNLSLNIDAKFHNPNQRTLLKMFIILFQC